MGVCAHAYSCGANILDNSFGKAIVVSKNDLEVGANISDNIFRRLHLQCVCGGCLCDRVGV